MIFQEDENEDRDLENGLLGGDSKYKSPSSSNPKDAIELKTLLMGTKSEQIAKDIPLASTEIYLRDLYDESDDRENDLDEKPLGKVTEYQTRIRSFINYFGALITGSESEESTHQALKHERYQPKWTALHHASAKCQCTLIRDLLESGDDPNVTDERGRTAIDVAGIAFYQGTHIESLDEVLQTLLERNGTFNTMKERKDSLDTPIHTAVELGCQESIKILLNAGVSVACLNSSGLTPLHLCIKNKQEECFKILLKHNSKDSETISKRANTRDHAGFTVLQAAVVKEWIQGVNILLDCGADVTATSDLPFNRYNNVSVEDFINFMYRLERIHETPVHLAADVGNQIILSKLLNSKNRSAVTKYNLIGQTPLYIAVRGGHVDCIKTLLNMEANVMNVTKEKQNALHIAIKFDQKKVVEFLLDLDYNIADKMVNSFDNTGYAPVHSATMSNRVDCIKLLAEKNFFLRLPTKGVINVDWTPLHIAAAKNFAEVAEIILKHDKAAIEDVDPKGRLPIHIAASHRNREVMAMLLRKGAVLSSQTEPDKKKAFKKDKNATALKMISSELPNPTQFLEEVLDSFIEPNINTGGRRLVSMDYRVFTKVSSVSQIKVIEDLVKYGHKKLLIHPLVESLIYLKWRTLFPIFCVVIIIHTIFALSMYGLIIADFHNEQPEIEGTVKTSNQLSFKVFSPPLILVILLELMYINIQRRRYFYHLENWTKLASILMASLLLSTCNISWAKEEWSRRVATVSLLLAWAQIMFLFSRFPNMGFYVLMFGSVSINIFKILLMFSFLILAFALCFMIQYHSKPPFEGTWEAVMKTIAMMTSEFEYGDLFGEKHAKELRDSKQFVQVMFIVFLIFVSIVFVNFMVGVAVSDVNDLKTEGNIRRLEKQVEFLSTLDVLAYGFGIKKFVTKKYFLKRFVYSMKIKPGVTKHWMVCYETKMNEETSTFENEISIPSHILDNIFNKIKTKKEQNKEKKDFNLLKKQVHFMYNLTTGFIDEFHTKNVLKRFYNEKELMQEKRIARRKNQSTQTKPTETIIRGPRHLGTRFCFTKRYIRRRRIINKNRLLRELKSKLIKEITKAKQSQLKRFKKLERMLKKY